GKLRVDLLLFNSYINYETITSYGCGGWIVDEFTDRKHQSRIGLESLTEGLELLSSELDEGDYIPAVNCESDDNDLGLDVADLIKEKNVELVVMGARSDTQDDIMFGADTNAIIENSVRPVFIIPTGTQLKNVHKIFFATDFEEADIKAIRYMAKLGELLHYKLEIIHVADPSKKSSTEKELAFDRQLAGIKYTGLQYHKLNSKDIVGRLNRFVSHTPGAILAMVHVQHSFLVRLFEHSVVKEALAHQKTPLLIFPSKMS
ncbi:MAG TPA: universal stress protein, partial [Mucilaginibacter sp.]|nr:universal stress protein [Mucilaginibacter sp.]